MHAYMHTKARGAQAAESPTHDLASFYLLDADAQAVHCSWGSQVEVVAADMRVWQPPALAHILVSELLGSFGDNELSPECLDGAQRLLAPHAISIPCQYTSYLQPITASKAWGDARVCLRLSGPSLHLPWPNLKHAVLALLGQGCQPAAATTHAAQLRE